MRLLCLLSVLILFSKLVDARSAQRVPEVHDRSIGKVPKVFNELVIGAERIRNDLGSEAAAVSQARTAFLVCASCTYKGPALDFLREMYSLDDLVDRRYIVDQIFPALAKAKTSPAHLWVGVRPYSMRYEYIFRADGASRFDTIEPDASQALYGSSQHHYVDIAQNIDQYVQPDTYDVAVVNGVLGWGIDTEEQTLEFYLKTARVMKPGAILVIGYNPHIGQHHLAGINEHFSPIKLGTLPQKKQFDIEWKHTYEFYEKKSSLHAAL